MPANSIISDQKGNKKVSLQDRFWLKVDRRGDNDCWPWKSCRKQQDYGRIFVGGRNRKATQISWEIANDKPFPAGMDACHSCDNPNCVNPKHIWPGTKSQNVLDALAKGRMKLMGACLQNAEKVYCSNGHLFSEDTTYVTTRGTRVCRICQRASNSAYKKRKSAGKVDNASLVVELRAKLAQAEGEIATMREALADLIAVFEVKGATVSVRPDRVLQVALANANIILAEHPHGD